MGSQLKLFAIAAFFFFALLVILLQIYTLKDTLGTIISGVLPLLLGILLQRPGGSDSDNVFLIRCI